MRILLVSHFDLNLVRFRKGLMDLLREQGHEVHAAVPPGDHRAALAEMADVIHDLPLDRQGLGALNPLKLSGPVKALRAILASVQPDIAHSFTHQPNVLLGLATTQAPPCVRMLSVTGLGSLFTPCREGKATGGWRAALARKGLGNFYANAWKRGARMVFQNPDDRHIFASRGWAPADASIVAGSGVDLGRYRPDVLSPEQRAEARAAWELEPGHMAVAMAARLVRPKGLGELLEAARMLERTAPRIRFLLAGEPDPGNPDALPEAELRQLEEQANIVRAGWQENMPRFWCAADLALLPSYREGVPVSLQEALACGLPVVTTDAPGCRHLAQGEHGVTIPARDSEALAATLHRLADDPAALAAMAAQARPVAEARFDARKLAQEMLDIYAEATA